MKNNSSKKLFLNRLFAILSGSLVPFSFSPFDLYFLSIFSLITIFYLWSRTEAARESFVLGYLFGFAMFGIGVNWLHISINLFGGVNLFFALFFTYIFIAFISLYPALTGYIANKYFKSNFFIFIPILWVLFEWAKGWILTGFPWLNIGTSQTNSILVGFAPIIGDYGVSFIVCIAATAVIKMFSCRKNERFVSISLLVIIFLASLILNEVNWTKNTGKILNVALVQGAIPQEIKWSPEQVGKSFNIYTDLSESFWSSDLIIWPETAIASKFHLANNFIERISKKRHGSNAFFMSGIVNENTGSDTYFNSIILIDNKHRFYNKHHLVPFGEYLPLREILYRPLSLFNIPVSNFASGKDTEKNFETDKGNFGMSICYEDAYGNEIRSSMPAANILINVSNDAWFGDSIAPHQHLQIARMRAIENGRYFLRATNNGISAIIDNRGNVISRSPQFEKHVLNSNVILFSGATPFSKYGDTPLFIFFALFIFIYILKRNFFKK